MVTDATLVGKGPAISEGYRRRTDPRRGARDAGAGRQLPGRTRRDRRRCGGRRWPICFACVGGCSACARRTGTLLAGFWRICSEQITHVEAQCARLHHMVVEVGNRSLPAGTQQGSQRKFSLSDHALGSRNRFADQVEFTANDDDYRHKARRKGTGNDCGKDRESCCPAARRRNGIKADGRAERAAEFPRPNCAPSSFAMHGQRTCTGCA